MCFTFCGICVAFLNVANECRGTISSRPSVWHDELWPGLVQKMRSERSTQNSTEINSDSPNSSNSPNSHVELSTHCQSIVKWLWRHICRITMYTKCSIEVPWWHLRSCRLVWAFSHAQHLCPSWSCPISRWLFAPSARRIVQTSATCVNRVPDTLIESFFTGKFCRIIWSFYTFIYIYVYIYVICIYLSISLSHYHQYLIVLCWPGHKSSIWRTLFSSFAKPCQFIKASFAVPRTWAHCTRCASFLCRLSLDVRCPSLKLRFSVFGFWGETNNKENPLHGKELDDDYDDWWFISCHIRQ
jgi:hypothetical protein